MNYLVNELMITCYNHSTHGIKSGKSVFELEQIIENKLDALEIIIKKLNIRIEKRIYNNDKNPHYFLKYNFNYTEEISEEKYKILERILNEKED